MLSTIVTRYKMYLADNFVNESEKEYNRLQGGQFLEFINIEDCIAEIKCTMEKTKYEMNKYAFSTQSGKAYYCNSIPGFIRDKSESIIGQLVKHSFEVNKEQSDAWDNQILSPTKKEKDAISDINFSDIHNLREINRLIENKITYYVCKNINGDDVE